MDAVQERLPLRILLDKEKNRVVLAEAGKDFVDILFGFLALPMGTIVRLVGNRQSSQPAVIGCMNNLYRSVEDLGTESFMTDACKLMLLHPRYVKQNQCSKLKLKIDDEVTIKYFICSHGVHYGDMSYYSTAKCSCGSLMNKEIGFEKMAGSTGEDRNTGVFVMGETMFIITDDLKTMHNSPLVLVELLGNLGINDVNQLVEKKLNVGLEEISNLLKHSLTSKSVLTDTFLKKQGTGSCTVMFNPRYSLIPGNEEVKAAKGSNITVKLMMRKSNKKILYAEAREDFIDLLVTFLTIPVESVMDLLGGNISLGCIGNLHKSLDDLNSKWSVTHDKNKSKHVLPRRYSFHNQLLNLLIEENTEYYCDRKGDSYCLTDSRFNSRGEFLHSMSIMDPKYTTPETASDPGYMKRLSMFLVSDDLVVTPLSSTSSISLLKGLEIPIDDFEEQVISIGEAEALGILRGSLFTASALTEGLNLILKNPKQENDVWRTFCLCSLTISIFAFWLAHMFTDVF